MSFYSWFLDLMHWKVKQKKCRSVCYHRKPQKCDQCNRRKSAQSTAAWSLSCSAIAMGLTPWCNFHSERGISENTMYAVHLTPENGDCMRWGGACLAWHGAGVSFLWHQPAHSPMLPPGGGGFSGKGGERKGTLVLCGTLVVHAVQYAHSIEQTGWMYSTHKGGTIT